ncbi:MAG TPA: hypothetical protein VI894_02730 [Candidatus Nanoarchaeia archaeon]|nr:hypothetical protein [Candidatus Nanoarchaeia archaeon]
MKKKECSISVFLMFLIVTLPLASAEFITVKIYNYNSIEGYASKDDLYTIEAVAKITGDANITKNQVKIAGSQFDVCNLLNEAQGTFRCYFNSYTNVLGAGVHTFDVKLYDDANNAVDSRSAVLIVDDASPELTFFEISQKSINENATIRFTAKDSACSASGCSGKCSGISEIKLFANEFEVSYANISSSRCENSGTAYLNLSSYNGRVEACGQAVDSIGKPSQKKCANISIDTQGPSFEWSGVSGSEGANLDYAKGPTKTVISFNVSDDSGVKRDSVQVDVKDLIKSEREARRSAECEVVFFNHSICRVSQEIDFTEERSGSITVGAEDLLGNSATASFPFTIGYDNESPKIEFLGTDAPNQSYAKAVGNTFIAKIKKTKSQISNKNAVLDVSSFGREQRIPADECVYATEWMCIWKDISVSESRDGPAVALLNLRDNAGNSAVGKTSLRMTIDKEIPKILNYSPVAEGLTAPDCPVPGETPQYNFIVQDSSPAFIYVDATNISDNAELIKAGCPAVELEGRASNIWNCTIGIDKLKSGPITANINFTISDSAGNERIAIKKIEVCAGDSNKIPNFLRLQVKKISPEKIDRKIASKTPVPVFIAVDLIGSANVVNTEIESCGKEDAEKKSKDKDATKKESKNIVDSAETPYLLNARSKNPVIALKIAKDDYKGVEIAEIVCKLKITVRKGGTVYLKPEVETVTAKISFYNLPIGYIDDNIQAKIDREKSEIKSLESQIKSRQESKDAFKETCKMLKLYAQISNTIHQIGNTLRSLGCVISLLPFTKAVGESIANAGKKMVEVFENTIGETKLGGVINPLKLICAMYSGKYCDPDAVADVAYSAFGAGLEQKLDAGYAQIDKSYNKPSKAEAVVIGTDWTKSPAKGKDEKDKNSETGVPPEREAPQYSGTSIIENPPTKWEWDPYKSIHYARACNFVPAEIYNYKKLKQIKCMYVNCLEQRSNAGLSTYVCDSAKEQRICLYYDSAQYRMSGLNLGNHLVKVVEAFIKKLFTNFVNKLICNKLESFKPVEGKGACEGVADSWCGLYNSMQRLLHIGDLFSGFKGFGDKDSEVSLGGPDYCAGIS